MDELGCLGRRTGWEVNGIDGRRGGRDTIDDVCLTHVKERSIERVSFVDSYHIRTALKRGKVRGRILSLSLVARP